MKRMFAGRMVLFFCCLSGLAWASHGLLNAQSGLINASNDVQIADMKIGWWFSACNRDATCVTCQPETCVNAQKTGCAVDVVHGGRNGCSSGGTFMQCGWAWCSSCFNNQGRCGVAQHVETQILAQDPDSQIVTQCGAMCVSEVDDQGNETACESGC